MKSLTESIRSDIKKNVEHFTEIPVRKLEVNVRDQKTSGPRVVRRDIMAENNNQNGQDSTQQLINIFKAFKWRIIGFLAFYL